jgi:hypothetical protein
MMAIIAGARHRPTQRAVAPHRSYDEKAGLCEEAGSIVVL